MGDDVAKSPWMKLDLPKPRRWDFIALAVAGLAAVIGAVNLRTAFSTAPGESISSGLTALFFLTQLAVASLALLVLGKTAKEGTLWGNLLAVAAASAGIGGALLAALLWTSA